MLTLCLSGRECPREVQTPGLAEELGKKADPGPATAACAPG